MVVNTPWKINMEPTHQPFRKENELPSLHDYVPAVNLPGCSPFIRPPFLWGGVGIGGLGARTLDSP